MKNILITLSLLCLSSYGLTQDIPSFESMGKGYVGCAKEEITYFILRNNLIFNENMPIEQIEPTLNQWYKENPEPFHHTEQAIKLCDAVNTDLKHDPNLLNAFIQAAQQATKLVSNLSYTDIFIMLAKIAAPHAEQPPFILERSQEVTRCLKQLNIQQTLSDEQLDLFAQLAIIEMYGGHNNCNDASETAKKMINILEQLIKTYNK